MPVALAAGFVALLTVGLISKSPNDGIDEALGRGESASAPSFQLPVLAQGDIPGPLRGRLASAFADGELALSELRGTPVVINFWASWCTPCREEASALESAWKTSAKDGVIFLGLNMQDLSDDALGFIDEFGATYPSVRDQTDEIAGDWGVTGIPETFFVSYQGRVVGHVIGAATESQLRAGTLAARTGEPIATSSGGSQGGTR